MNSQDQDLASFIDKIIAEKPELNELDPEIKAEIKNELMEQAEDRINAMIFNNIPKDKMSEFQAVTESGTDEEIQTFCQNTIPGLPELIASELLVFRDTYLA